MKMARKLMPTLALLCLLWVPSCWAQSGSTALYCWNPNGSQATNNQYVPCQPGNPLAVSGNTNVATYSASASFTSSSTGASDLFCIYGSATKTIKIKGARITGVNSGSATNTLVELIRRSTLPTGGTQAVITPAASDPANPAATASAFNYTTAPTAGTSQGIARVRYITIAATTTTNSEGLFQFSVYWDQPQVLRGVNNGFCVNAPTPSNTTWAIDMEWSEE